MDIAVRAVLVFVLLFVAIRASGKREISQLSAFELVLLVSLGDFVAQALLQEDYSFTGALIVSGVFVLLSVFLSWLGFRFPAMQPVVDGRATILLRDGSVDDDAMRAERLPMDDLLAAARQHGVRDLADVDLVVLETDGGFSFFSRAHSGDDDGDDTLRRRITS